MTDGPRRRSPTTEPHLPTSHRVVLTGTGTAGASRRNRAVTRLASRPTPSAAGIGVVGALFAAIEGNGSGSDKGFGGTPISVVVSVAPCGRAIGWALALSI